MKLDNLTKKAIALAQKPSLLLFASLGACSWRGKSRVSVLHRRYARPGQPQGYWDALGSHLQLEDFHFHPVEVLKLVGRQVQKSPGSRLGTRPPTLWILGLVRVDTSCLCQPRRLSLCVLQPLFFNCKMGNNVFPSKGKFSSGKSPVDMCISL